MSCGRQRGFTYVAVLILVATVGGVAAAYAELTSHAAQREREKELLFIGNEFRKAIASYYQRTPGAITRYPRSLEDLLEDRRFSVPVRHLRRVYRDPMTGFRDWGLVQAPDGGIMGIYSLSHERPVKTAGFAYRDAGFDKAKTYADWRFMHLGDSPLGLPRARAGESPK